jgi:hypothetical protein
MQNQSARFQAGHFFRTVMLFCLLWAGNGCNGNQIPGNSGSLNPETGEITILIEFPATIPGDEMPEAAAGLPGTSVGRFLAFDGIHDDLMTTAEKADSSGKLLLLVIPLDVQFSGQRDHLIIWTDSSGMPVRVSPELDPVLLSDSLWENPVERQRTILHLIDFFKPDIVLEFVPEAFSSSEVTSFWSRNAALNNLTVALFVSPVEERSYRGWGIFTGEGIRSNLLLGMNIQGFFTTVKMISSLNWNDELSEYPAMQAFTIWETE